MVHAVGLLAVAEVGPWDWERTTVIKRHAALAIKTQSNTIKKTGGIYINSSFFINTGSPPTVLFPA